MEKRDNKTLFYFSIVFLTSNPTVERKFNAKLSGKLCYECPEMPTSAGLAFVHMYHVSTLFENDRHFSHLSDLEREMTFRTEMGFYYHFYKTIIESSSLEDGLNLLLRDNLTEHPSVINAVQRFNLYPEIFIGGLFRLFTSVSKSFGISTTQCWEVSRGSNLPPVISCEGLGDPMYFYLEFVWYAAGLTKAVLFLYAVFLSGSVTGGMLAILGFMYNHGHCTRVQWTPPLRESFAYPFCLLQMLAVSSVLREQTLPKSSFKPTVFLQVLKISLTTLLCLLLWQFSQFFIATQTTAILILFTCGIITRNHLLTIVFGQLIGLFLSFLFMFGNELLFQSVLFSLLIATLPTVIIIEDQLPFFSLRSFIIPSVVYVFFTIFKTKINGIYGVHDAHILHVLQAKVSNYKNFHTLLYTCSAEFDFLPFGTLIDLTKTLLIPTTLFVLICISYKLLKSFIEYKKNCYILNQRNNQSSQVDKKLEKEGLKLRKSLEPDIIYNILQLGAFTIMAFFIMRLKLFWTPHLCLMTSLFVSNKFIPLPKKKIRSLLTICLIAGMSYKGVQNVMDQRKIIGEYSDIPFEDVLQWIKSETRPNDVFAGSMSVMANVLLSTRRPVANHPHYEHWKMRERTISVYSVFSRQTPEEVFQNLVKLGVDYVILDENVCFAKSSRNCSMTDIWDAIDSKNIYNEPVCPRLFSGNPSPFRRVFSNDVFVILSVKTHQVIQVVAKQSFQM